MKITKSITSTLGILVIMLGLVPLPFINSVIPVYAQEITTPSEEPVVVEDIASVDLTQSVEEAIVEQTVMEDAPVVEDAPILEETIVEETLLVDPLTQVDLVQIVEELADAGVVLVNENQEPVSLASTEVANILSVPDPYFTRGGVTYRYLTDCTGYLTNCTVSTNPIQAAIDDVTANGLPDDGTIYVEKGTYEENLTISVDDLTLYGDPGNTTASGAGLNAPTLEGTNLGGNGIFIDAVGVSIIGFIIQNYQNAILLDPSGNSDFTAENNTIKDNEIGVYNKNAVPGIELHFNEFSGNTTAIKNDDVRGLQYIEAQNNDWNCSVGPIVKYLSGGNYVYVLWSTKAAVDPADYPGCEILLGENSKWDHQINTSDYSPFKINLGTLAAGEVLGCMDITANNYNALATTDDGTCTFDEQPPTDVLGCTDITATNYNALATVDNGTCEYPVDPPITTTPGDPGTPPTFVTNLLIPITGGENFLIPVTGADLSLQTLVPFGGTLLLGISFLVKGIYSKIKK